METEVCTDRQTDIHTYRQTDRQLPITQVALARLDKHGSLGIHNRRANFADFGGRENPNTKGGQDQTRRVDVAVAVEQNQSEISMCVKGLK